MRLLNSPFGIRIVIGRWLLKHTTSPCGCQHDHVVYYHFGCKLHDPEEAGSPMAGAQRIEAAPPRPQDVSI